MNTLRLAARALRRMADTEYERPKAIPVQEKLQDVVQEPAEAFVEESEETTEPERGDVDPYDVFMPRVNVLHAVPNDDDEKVLKKIEKLPGYDNVRSLALRDVDR